MLKHNYKINTEIQTIVVTLNGDLVISDMVSLGVEILQKAKELKYKVVFDCRQSRVKISMGDAYFLYVDHYDHIDIGFRNVPISYIVNKEDWSFYSGYR